MQTISHVAMGNWPTQEDWEKARHLLELEISKSKELKEPVREIGFFEFMTCVLFVLEKVGVKSLVNANDVMNCLEKLYEENMLFYPSHIFRGAWEEKLGENGKEISLAKKFFMHLKEIQMVSFIYGRENVLVLCSSDYASEDTKKHFHSNLELASYLFKNQKENQKYILQIFFVAKDLLMAMHKGDVGNIL
ncbi:MAG: hypothetical protein ACYC3G_03920 [Minisyncoccota bacterium]